MAVNVSFGKGLRILLLVMVTTLAFSQAETIVVGGSEGWHPGFNYSDWSLKHGPFFIKDVLVFKYAPPSDTARPHSVYLLPNLYSFMTCNFSRATLLANASEGSGDGFAYELKTYRNYYFASGGGEGEINANDCNKGFMKFFAFPLPRPSH